MDRVTTSELTLSTAHELAASIRSKQFSASEALEAYLRRIDERNGELRAIVQLDVDGARAAAAAADATIAAGADLGPLHGVPVTIKDWIEIEGLVCAAGFEERRNFVPRHDATVVTRMRAAGAVLLGKAKSGIEDDVYPAARNPYDPARTAGGSSSGDCVAVAAGMSALGLGSDSGGSLRLPAHFCGVATIKPTTGRVPNTGHFPRLGDMSDPRTTIGPIARSAFDLHDALRVIAGPDWRDPSVGPMPLGDPADVDLLGLRAAVYTDMPEMAATPETAAAVRAAAGALENAGVALHRDRPPRIEESLGITRDYWARSSSVSWNTWHPSHPHRLTSAEDVERSVFEWERLRRTFLAWMENYDLIVCPVAADVAGTPGSVNDVTFLYTLPYSLTGYPAAVVRAGTSSEGMPIGVQLVARPWREDVAIAAACAVETALGGWQPPSR
jgi:amidase